MTRTLPIATLTSTFFLDKNCNLFYKKSGKEVLAKTSNGYRAAYVKRNLFLAHRIVWALYYGSWPEGMLDHIDGNKLNNNINNLRLADGSLNSHNKKEAQLRSRTGVRGVTLDGNKFHARLMVKGKLYLLGNYDSIEEAQTAYLNAKRKYVKGFINV